MCFTGRLDTAEEGFADLEVIAMESSKTSKQREQRPRKQIDY